MRMRFLSINLAVVAALAFSATALADRSASADGRANPRNYSARVTKGNVWYFGEDTAELDSNGNDTSTEGSWKTGVDGAKPGSDGAHGQGWARAP
jgi:hypothetical protein